MEAKQNIVFIGDSLTAFYDWQARFAAYNTINLGVSGETVEGLLGRIDKLPSVVGIAGRKPHAIFIMTGINNIAMEDYDIIGSYKQVIAAVNRLFGASRLIIQSILPVRLPWVDNVVIRELNEKLKDMAKQFRASYLDLFSLFMGPDSLPVKDFLLDDGIHISSKGYEVWSGTVKDLLYSLQSAGV